MTDGASVVLTHWHRDHSGAAADLAAVTGATVWAGGADADVLTGDRPAEHPDLTDEERPIFERLLEISPDALDPPRCPTVRSLSGHASIDPEGRAVVLDVPGHTAGSIAIAIPELRVVITGDVAINDPHAGLRVWPFNADVARAIHQHRYLIGLGAEVLAVGHGSPVTTVSS
jgi:glyoxylase-like metal-dependent hydrolase (beta-lactamase superfamily II)